MPWSVIQNWGEKKRRSSKKKSGMLGMHLSCVTDHRLYSSLSFCFVCPAFCDKNLKSSPCKAKLQFPYCPAEGAVCILKTHIGGGSYEDMCASYLNDTAHLLPNILTISTLIKRCHGDHELYFVGPFDKGF